MILPFLLPKTTPFNNEPRAPLLTAPPITAPPPHQEPLSLQEPDQVLLSIIKSWLLPFPNIMP